MCFITGYVNNQLLQHTTTYFDISFTTLPNVHIKATSSGRTYARIKI